VGLSGVLTAQLVVQRYAPTPHVPSAGDRHNAPALLARLRGVKGEVLMPYHPYYPVLVGGRPSYHQMGINDVTRAGYPMPQDILDRVRRRRYAVVVLDNPPGARYAFLFDPYKLGYYFPWKTSPRVVTGYPVRPTYWFVLKRAEPPPPGQVRVFGFEGGTFRGWTVTGRAFGDSPEGGPVWSQGPVGPFEGSYLVTSFHGGDPAVGTLKSPPFTLAGDTLYYRVSGGQDLRRLAVRILVGGKEVHRGSGTGSDIMQERRVDISAHRGERATLELVDHATGPWGHISFDDLRLGGRRT